MPKIDGERLGREMLEATKVYVAKVAAPIAGRVDVLERRLNELPQPQKGDRGDPGPQGESVKGDPGEPGKDGESIHPDTVALMVRDYVDKAVSALPRAKDGEPGRDAAALEILPVIDLAKSYPRGTLAECRGGVIRAIRNTDPVTDDGLAAAGWTVVWNGIAEESEETFDEGRTTKRITTYTDGSQFVREQKTSSMLYRGVWRPGTFERGDICTWKGSSFHCEKTTTDEPETSDAWKLMVKRGRDGKPAQVEAPPRNDPIRLR